MYNKTIKLQDNEIAAKINTETGILTTIKAFTNQQTDVVCLNYENYFSLNVTVLERLTESKLLSRTDKGYILDMCTMLKTEYNALYTNNNIPHTITTLSSTLELHYDKMRKLLKRLVKIGILGRLVTADRELFVMNPFIARKRKFVSKEVSKIFNDFS
jgi:hypothetical protein